MGGREKVHSFRLLEKLYTEASYELEAASE